MQKSYENLKSGKIKDNQREFELEIPVTVLNQKSDEVLNDLVPTFELAGFRKGKVPIEKIRERVDIMHIFEKASEKAIKDVIQELIEDEHLTPLGYPTIIILKFAPQNPITLKITFALTPEIKLPDYKKIAREIINEHKEPFVDEQKINETLKELQKMVHTRSGKAESDPLPELNDEFIKQFGPFGTLEEFKNELRKEVEESEKFKHREAQREKIMKEIIAHTKIDTLPPLIINEEFEEYVKERDENLKKENTTLEDYLRKAGKTKEQLENEMRSQIKERLTARLIVRKLEEQENITADEKEIHETAHILEKRYLDRDHHFLNTMAEAMIMNERLFEKLEKSE